MAAAAPQPPLVSIGIPTYNRAASVERAIRSALDQDHPRIEVVVSDDGSSDGTRELCEEWAGREPRLRYVRRPVNGGHAANFQSVLELAGGEYFMWLSDDDWLERDYVGVCLAALTGDPGCALAAGRARYHAAGAPEVAERLVELTARSAGLRVLRYFATVNVNGHLYGLMRRADVLRVGFPAVLGGDWLVVSSMAARGRVRMLGETAIHRSAEGISRPGGEGLAREFGLRGLARRLPHGRAALTCARVIAGGRLGFGALPAPVRVPVAAGVAVLVAGRFEGYRAVSATLDRLRLRGLARRLVAPLRARRHA